MSSNKANQLFLHFSFLFESIFRNNQILICKQVVDLPQNSAINLKQTVQIQDDGNVEHVRVNPSNYGKIRFAWLEKEIQRISNHRIFI